MPISIYNSSWHYAQIILILKATHRAVGGTQVPFPYGQLVDIFDFVTLDLVSFVPFGKSYAATHNTSATTVLSTIQLIQTVCTRRLSTTSTR